MGFHHQKLKSLNTGIFTESNALVCPETKHFVYVVRENVCIKKICSLKIEDFWFKFSPFSRLFVDFVSQIMSHLLYSLVSVALSRSQTQKFVTGLVVKLQIK